MERRIRLWVVQLERERLNERPPEPVDPRDDERMERRRLQAAARANKR